MKSHFKKNLLIGAVALISILALALPNQATSKVCNTCSTQCAVESYELYYQCRETNSPSYCIEQQIDYDRRCQAIFCEPLGCPYEPH